MSGDLSVVDKYVEEILIDLMVEKVMSLSIQALSMGGLQASPSIGRRSMSQTVTEKKRKHRDDLANAK
jgi:hypothetical protein